MQRRDFIRGAVSLSAFPYHLFASPTKKSASDVVEQLQAQLDFGRGRAQRVLLPGAPLALPATRRT